MFHKIVTGLMVMCLMVITPFTVLQTKQMSTEVGLLTDRVETLRQEVRKPTLSFTQIREATKLVQVGELGNGSGVMVAPRRLLTAAHVAVNGSPENPLLVDGKVAKVLKIDEENDLALLEVDAVCPCVPVGYRPRNETRVAAVGFPVFQIMGTQILTEGRVQGLKENRLLATTPIAPGNSGGGLFAIQDGKWVLVGITVSVAMTPIFGMYPNVLPHLMLAVDTNTIKGFLKNVR